MKRLLYKILSSAVVLSVSVLLGCGTSESIPSLPAETPTCRPTPPAKGLCIVIDAGHGNPDGGAEGVTGAVEAGLNLSVANMLKDELTAMGHSVTMTRSDENALADTKRADMSARRDIMNAPGVDMVISVHMNKFTDSSVCGPMVFYMEGSAEGERLAKTIIDSLCEALGRPKRLANPGDYFVIRESIPVAVIVECGFLSNPNDEKLLTTEAHQRLLAKAISAGIADYINQKSEK